MRIFIFLLLFLFGIASQALAKNNISKVTILSQLLRVEANPEKGFNFPFFLYIPEIVANQQSLLILPNNSTILSDDVEVQAKSAKHEAETWEDLSEATSAVLLVPAFPRPAENHPAYTHALTRNTLLIKDGPLKRIDLQLIKMSEEARIIVHNKTNRFLKPKFFLFGFSASAMFVNRFTFIHPELVSAIALGAPGGWPLAPMKEYQKKNLPYPIGIYDLEEIIGRPIDFVTLKKVPFFMFLGAKDENDSVIFRDGYTATNQELVFSLFGKKPIERWPIAEKLYKEAGLNVEFKLYNGIGHGTNRAVLEDIVKFFKGHM